MSKLHLYDFGIFLELEPDVEEQQLLENNIQGALANQSIELEDAIDLRQIKNIKLANQMLKLRRRKKGDEDQRMQLEQTKAQGESQAQASEAAAAAEIKKNKAMLDTQMKLESLKTDGKSQILAQEAQIKKQLMAMEHQNAMQLKQMEMGQASKAETQREDRKDQRTRIQATQQSELIDQRNSQGPPKNFENEGQAFGDFETGNFEGM